MTDRGLLATLLAPVCDLGDRTDATAGATPSTTETENVVVDPTETMDVETAPAVDDELVFVASDVSGGRPYSETSYAAAPPSDD